MKFLRCAPWLAAMTFCLLAVPSSAQDAIVGEPGWFATQGLPDTPPRFRHRPQVTYPRELRGHDASGTGYVLITRYLDADGESQEVAVSDPYPRFRWAVEHSGSWRMRPAEDHGKPVPSWFWVPVIFNPAAADPHGADAIPRLLAVAPVIVPGGLMQKMGGRNAVWGTVSLDAAGIPQKVALVPGEPEQVLPEIEAALKHWRFSPARRAGQPVAADLRVAFVLHAPEPAVPKERVPPRVLQKKRPLYPHEMSLNRMVGRVRIGFVVDTNGTAVDPVVLQSNNPGFDRAAIDAVLQWKFAPATVNGHPVNARMEVPMVFRFEYNAPGREAYAVETAGAGDQERLPTELRYDVPPKLRRVVRPVYPYELLRDGVRGEASAIFEIGETGRVVAVKITAATRPEFGRALEAALETFVFFPARRDGLPTASVMKTKQVFSTADSAELVSDAARSLLRQEKRKPQTIAAADRLDAPLKPLSRQSPVFPPELAGKVKRGTATVEMLVDRTGHAQLARIVEASDPAFGYAAVQAVSQWLFAPPRVGGKPAVVRVVVPFEFDAKPAK